MPPKSDVINVKKDVINEHPHVDVKGIVKVDIKRNSLM